MSRLHRYGVAALAAAACTVALGACASNAQRTREILERAAYPPPPQAPRVVALGNLGSGALPTDAQVRLSIFLFGEQPEPPVAFLRPMYVAADPNGVLVCDAAIGAVLRWDTKSADLRSVSLSPRPSRPVVARLSPNGDILVADAGNAAVLRFDPQGKQTQSYRLAPERFKPASFLMRSDELWVTNVLQHCIEVFDLATAKHLRSIGGRGGAAGQFGTPLGMAQAPDGNVCVVDMLNSRVQVLDPTGRFVKTIGGPGDRVGYFGRPKDVAVGPDGTVFVTDAATQRVHAFNAQGQPLLAFGEPSESPGALAVPCGISISTQCPVQKPSLPGGFTAEYYVLVAEQLLRPGIRIYAWGSMADAESVIHPAAAKNVSVSNFNATNPHWAPSRCNDCHNAAQGGAKLSAAQADTLCLSCHDGQRAYAELHPVGRIALTADTTAPDGWPLVDGRLGCLTCHDIRRHCDPATRRPSTNSAMLRAFDPDRPMQLCAACHSSTDAKRLFPHLNVDAAGHVIESSCTLCHVEKPPIPADGRPRGQPRLLADGSRLCLSCHPRHWDVSPRGHVDREADEQIRRTVAARNSSSDGAVVSASDSPKGRAWIPLPGGRVTCYSCHNPHQPTLFPPGSPLGAVSAEPSDAHKSLRVPSFDLCLTCHVK